MTERPSLNIQRDLDDIKLQVKKELATIRDLMDTVGYRKPSTTWSAPFQIHRLRRALRIHYLAMKIRDSNLVNISTRELAWEVPTDIELL
ncbi:hypothetical protein EU528_02950 [Candidatus Thorarchaeota archaeon]|nr:MAG: hypothetical protein EU528_02950 [Candidatus Thorarchaeota archaeon]